MVGSLRVVVRPALRFLGLLVPLFIGLPSAIGLLYFVFNPGKAIEFWPGILMSLFFALVCGISGWRWWRLGANISESEIVMRGIFRTVRIPIDGFQQIDKVWSQANNENSSDQSFRYLFVDSAGAAIAELPASLAICVDFKEFVSHLEQIAARNRKKSGDSPKRDLSSLPVDQWTLQDIEKYEREN